MTGKRTDLERLALFRDRAIELGRRRILAVERPGFSFRVNSARPDEYEIDADEEDFFAMLVHLRPFMLQNEDVYLPSAHNVLMRLLTHDGLRERAIQNREEWRRLISGWGFGQFTIVRPDSQQSYGRYELFELTMNAKIFHHDANKEREFDNLPPIFKAHAQAALYDTGFSAAALVRNEGAIIAAAFERSALAEG